MFARRAVAPAGVGDASERAVGCGRELAIVAAHLDGGARSALGRAGLAGTATGGADTGLVTRRRRAPLPVRAAHLHRGGGRTLGGGGFAIAAAGVVHAGLVAGRWLTPGAVVATHLYRTAGRALGCTGLAHAAAGVVDARLLTGGSRPPFAVRTAGLRHGVGRALGRTGLAVAAAGIVDAGSIARRRRTPGAVVAASLYVGRRGALRRMGCAGADTEAPHTEAGTWAAIVHPHPVVGAPLRSLVGALSRPGRAGPTGPGDACVRAGSPRGLPHACVRTHLGIHPVAPLVALEAPRRRRSSAAPVGVRTRTGVRRAMRIGVAHRARRAPGCLDAAAASGAGARLLRHVRRRARSDCS
jgi:hypothetical protein